MPETVIVPEPTSRMPPTPADTYSVLTTVANWTSCDPKHHRLNIRISNTLRYRALRRLGALCFATWDGACRTHLNSVPARSESAAAKMNVTSVVVFNIKYPAR